MKYVITPLLLFVLLLSQVFAQPKGKLFIIGGGHKSNELMQKLVVTAGLAPKDYIVILPMSTAEPDSAYYYITKDFKSVCSNQVISFNFTKNDINKTAWLDSLQHAKLVFITGGDQSRFMNIVLHTPIQAAIKQAYNNGSTIAGTSAGAALMSKYMISGSQLLGDTSYAATFPKLWDNNIDIKEGLGLLDSAVIDMHFVERSRYNRLLTALAKYPGLPCIGISEGTAVIINGNSATISGTGQVIVFSRPQHLQVTKEGLIKFDDVHMHIYTDGDSFMLE